jgi:hypothetical protein
MAKFNVGDRVRVAALLQPRVERDPEIPTPVGLEGVVTANLENVFYTVQVTFDPPFDDGVADVQNPLPFQESELEAVV